MIAYDSLSAYDSFWLPSGLSSSQDLVVGLVLTKMTQNGLKWILNTTLKIVTFFRGDPPPPIVTFVTIFFFNEGFPITRLLFLFLFCFHTKMLFFRCWICGLYASLLYPAFHCHWQNFARVELETKRFSSDKDGSKKPYHSLHKIPERKDWMEEGCRLLLQPEVFHGEDQRNYADCHHGKLAA